MIRNYTDVTAGGVVEASLHFVYKTKQKKIHIEISKWAAGKHVGAETLLHALAEFLQSAKGSGRTCQTR